MRCWMRRQLLNVAECSFKVVFILHFRLLYLENKVFWWFLKFIYVSKGFFVSFSPFLPIFFSLFFNTFSVAWFQLCCTFDKFYSLDWVAFCCSTNSVSFSDCWHKLKVMTQTCPQLYGFSPHHNSVPRQYFTVFLSFAAKERDITELMVRGFHSGKSLRTWERPFWANLCSYIWSLE